MERKEFIRTIVRICPVENREECKKNRAVINVDSINQLEIFGENDSFEEIENSRRNFQLDFVFLKNAAQKEVFNEAFAPLVEQVIQGINVSVIAMGPTGYGKTYTLFGGDTGEAEGLIS